MGWDWVARIGGYVAAPFTGGASIPIGEAIAQGISNDRATDKAAGQLTEAGNQAIGTMTQAYAPYMNLGGQAANTLGGLMGFSPAPQAMSAAPPMTGEMPAPAQGTPMRKGGMSTEGPIGSKRYPGDYGTLASMQTASSFGPKASGGLVRMIAPDGTPGEVPEQFAAQLEAKGARRI